MQPDPRKKVNSVTFNTFLQKCKTCLMSSDVYTDIGTLLFMLLEEMVLHLLIIS